MTGDVRWSWTAEGRGIAAADDNPEDLARPAPNLGLRGGFAGGPGFRLHGRATLGPGGVPGPDVTMSARINSHGQIYASGLGGSSGSTPANSGIRLGDSSVSINVNGSGSFNIVAVSGEVDITALTSTRGAP